MKLFGRSKEANDAGADEVEEAVDTIAPMRTEAWTGGASMGAKALSALLFGAIACGPVGLGVWALSGSAEAPLPVAAAPSPVGLTAAEQRAGAFGEQFLSAYFRATRDDTAPLAEFLTNFEVSSTVAVEYRDLVVAGVDEGDEGQFTVTLSALVNEVTTSGQMQWVNRQYQVAVSGVDSTLAVVAPPMLVQEETGLDTTKRDYPAVASSSPVWTAANDFLVPYFTGTGDITRSVTPGADLTPPTSPNYVAIDLVRVGAHEEIPAEPVNGEVLHLEATIRATAAAESVHTYVAWITVTSRDGRWEVSSLDPYPFTTTPTETPNA
ncbi:conjugal transfer protein [Pseudoclavibacter sp. AY1H1]|uniref:conjugal transfer protein n=1 Tax=Pseudoclavibacter sp. AY1H1 TaxID=2080584 RepID=UPI000CE78C36|nr:conjugal transfer protein [Pseudoclavibacter sp. AY1H1]PPF32630.1 hypothetical protein C5E05_19185 [Pseudoclavibacter sp. AY1H1]